MIHENGQIIKDEKWGRDFVNKIQQKLKNKISNKRNKRLSKKRRIKNIKNN